MKPINQTSSQRSMRLATRIYLPRTIGLAMGGICVAAGFLEAQRSDPWIWVALAVNALLWPHIAYFLAKRAAEPRRAERMLEDMSDLFRVLMADNRKLVPLADEIALCRKYLEIETIRLGERLTGAKVGAVLLGLAGVAVIVRPGASVNAGQLIALVAALGFAVAVIMVKALTRTDAAIQVSFWMLVVQSVIGALPALATWHWPSAGVWGWVLLVAFCGTYSHYCFARAMAHADATVVVPMDFLRVPLSALAGWAVYAERVDGLTVAGMALILCGNLLNLRRAAPR